MNGPPNNPSTPGPRVFEILQKFGDYHLVAKLARGGMAEIFLAKRFGLGGFERNVVIKRMLDDISAEAEFVTMFLDEARLAAKLTHPNIAQITDFGAIDEQYYICMEHIAGEDLRAIIGRCRDQNTDLPIDVCLRILLAVCEGLEYAHELTEEGRPQNIVHRDISPSNIMVTYQGSVKLLDFGIAKATSRRSETTSGRLKGKIPYMSPEQINGVQLDGRSDIFSLGLTFFELLTKKRVFQRDTEMSSLNAVLHAPIPKPSEFRKDLPPEIDTIIMRSVERDTAARYASAAAMRKDLQAYLALIDTEPGTRKLADFMLSFFGRQQMERRTKIPSLADHKPTKNEIETLRAVGAAGNVPVDTYDATAAAPTADPKRSDTYREAKTRRDPPRGALMGALVALGVIGVAGGAFVLLRSKPAAPPQVAVPVAEAPKPAPAAAPAPTPPPVATAPASAPAAMAATAARPRPAPAAPAVELTANIVGSVIGKSHAKLLACFEHNRAVLPAKEGQVILSLAVAQAGNVANAEVATPGISSTPLSSCIAKEMKRLQFPRHKDKLLEMRVPFNYRVP